MPLASVYPSVLQPVIHSAAVLNNYPLSTTTTTYNPIHISYHPHHQQQNNLPALHSQLPLPFYKPVQCLPFMQLSHQHPQHHSNHHNHNHHQHHHMSSCCDANSTTTTSTNFFSTNGLFLTNSTPTSTATTTITASPIYPHGPLLIPITTGTTTLTATTTTNDLWINQDRNTNTALLLENSLGYGAFGVVWSACDPRNGQKVALKRIPHVFHNVISAKRAYRELFMLANLNHLNIISLIDFAFIENFHNFSEVYVLTEYMDTDLHKIIISPKPLTEDHVKLFFYQILRGVAYLHSAGIIHRDLKPGNLLVNVNCLIKICDFGLARIDEVDCPFLTQEVITQYYRPPELLTGVTRYSFAVDMWSVGCIFAELLSRRILFQASTPMQQLERIVEFLGTPCSLEVAKIPAEVRNYLQYCNQLRQSRVSSITDSTEAKSLLLALLRWDPDSRLTAKEALDVNYVESGRARFHYTLCDCCPRPKPFYYDDNNSTILAANNQPNFKSSSYLEPECPFPLQAGFDAEINTMYQGKVKLWSLMQDYFLNDNRSTRVKVNPMAVNYRSFIGSTVAMRSGRSQITAAAIGGGGVGCIGVGVTGTIAVGSAAHYG